MKQWTKKDIGSQDAPGWFPKTQTEWPTRSTKAVTWLGKIKDPEIRERAIAICHWPDRPCLSITDALINACRLWAQTEEGEIYWRKVYNSYAGSSFQIQGIYETDPLPSYFLNADPLPTTKLPNYFSR